MIDDFNYQSSLFDTLVDIARYRGYIRDETNIRRQVGYLLTSIV